jgi:hypothetical protein
MSPTELRFTSKPAAAPAGSLLSDASIPELAGTLFARAILRVLFHSVLPPLQTTHPQWIQFQNLNFFKDTSWPNPTGSMYHIQETIHLSPKGTF